MKPRVLFVINEVAHYGEFKRILSDEKICSKIEPLFLFDRDGYDSRKLFAKEIQDCEKSKINYKVLAHSNDIPNRFIRHLDFRLPSIRFITDIFKQVRTYRAKIAQLRSFYEENKIDTVILGEENVLLDTFVYKRAFTKKVFVYPYTIPNPKEMAGGAYKVVPSNSFKAFLYKTFAKDFTRDFEGHTYLLLSLSRVWALHILNYSPVSPWILNSDSADFIFIESQKMAELYNSYGIPSSKTVISGSLSDDLIFRSQQNKEILRNSFLKTHHLPDRPIILVGFPPNQFPRMVAEHHAYADLISSFIKSLSPYKEQFNIVITKHPRTTDSLSDLSEAGFLVTTDSTLNLIPFSHIYIASASATIRWAISAGIPVINYDSYRYHYQDYKEASAVLEIQSEKEFQDVLKQLLTDLSYYKQLCEIQARDSLSWSQLDGRVASRILTAIYNATNSGSTHENT